MSMRSDHVHRWLRDARSRGETVRARCLDDKLSQLHAAERLALPEVRRALSAAARQDVTELYLGRLEHLASRSGALYAEAGWCGRAPVVRLPTRTEVRVYVPRLPPE